MSRPDVAPTEWRTAASWQAAATAFLFYDYLLTFNEEIECIWKRKFSSISLICILARYLALADRVARHLQWAIVIRNNDALADQVRLCTALMYLDDALTTILYILLAIFTALRVYAIWGGNRSFAAVTFILAMGAPCATTYYDCFLQTKHAPSPLIGCQQHFIASSALNKKLYVPTLFRTAYPDATQLDRSAIESGFAVVSELTVVIFIWLKTASMRLAARRENVKTPLITLLQRDGSLYFLACAFPAVLSVMNKNLENMAAFSSPVAIVCFSRFMMRLRYVQTQNESGHPIVSAVPYSSAIRFSTHISFGAETINEFGGALNPDTKQDQRRQ